MMNNYFEYTFELSDDIDKDLVISILSDFEFEGFIETEMGFLAYIAQEKDNSEWYEVIEDLSNNIKFSKNIIEPKNWNEEWEKNYEIAVINEQCEIYAPFHNINPNITYPLLIEPKMSFGTGHHATTFMMCNLLFEFAPHIQNKTVIDIGCGTGILGILSEKLGAEKIYAIDNDDICIENTLENIQKNTRPENQKKFTVEHADIETFLKKYPEFKADVIIANIQKNVILNDLNFYQNIINTNGFILLSGILKEDENDILFAAKKFQHIITKYKNEWIAIVLQNKNKN